MSDTMLLAVLNMPHELWSDSPVDVLQRHARYRQAAQRIEEDRIKIRLLELELLKYQDDTNRLNWLESVAKDHTLELRPSITKSGFALSIHKTPLFVATRAGPLRGLIDTVRESVY